VPYTVNDKEWDNSYVCSPYNQFVTYAKEELYLIRSKVAKWILTIIIDLFGALAKWSGLNKNIIFNNWLFSTNLYGDLEKDHISQLVEFAKKNYKDHAILFRSVNKCVYGKLLDNLKDLRFSLVGSRQIYYVNPQNKKNLHRHSLRIDLKLLKKTDYTIELVTNPQDSEASRIINLYNQLYLEKYSYNNPQYTEYFIRQTLKNGIFKCYALKKNNQINGMLCLFSRGGVMTPSLIGYDRSLPRSEGLYRLIMISAFLIARKENKIIHYSSGSASYKRFPGGMPDIEYIAVHHSHLSWRRRFAWKVLELIINTIGVPIMKKYKL
ncbi:MAG: hypothetical protein OXB84_02655, partial [Halobacteriovoraceae bacterium]|nr:hypothetical protein [Halobacteriovoraceae bacterium]